jgi:hypothetical protein
MYTVPHIAILDLPEGERDEVSHLYDKLGELKNQVANYRAALDLECFCAEQRELIVAEYEQLKGPYKMTLAGDDIRARWERQQIFRAWANIASRDASLTVYHFRCALISIQKNLKKCPTVAEKVSQADLDTLAERFEMSFPDAVSVRHITAHAVDMTFTKEQASRHAIHPQEGQGISIPISSSGSTIISSRREPGELEARIVAFEFSVNTLNSLVQIMEATFALFRSLDWSSSSG